jgi:hypothetical protein
MDAGDIAKALTVPFAAGFIVQRFLEILDPLIADWFKNPNVKKMWLGFASLAIGIALAWSLHLRIFHDLLQLDCDDLLQNIPDYLASGIFISAGTEGFNTVMKFANYKKDASKADAASKIKNIDAEAIKAVNPQK